ncbi:MAG: BrnA antitoxin family protein [Steroidobacteraceae bacterium]
MKRQSSSKKSLTNFRRLRSMKDKDILLSAEHPEADLKHIVRGIVRSGLKVVPPKRSVSLRIDADVLEWFKSKGAGYQTRINSVLRAFTEVAR